MRQEERERHDNRRRKQRNRRTDGEKRRQVDSVVPHDLKLIILLILKEPSLLSFSSTVSVKAKVRV